MSTVHAPMTGLEAHFEDELEKARDPEAVRKNHESDDSESHEHREETEPTAEDLMVLGR